MVQDLELMEAKKEKKKKILLVEGCGNILNPRDRYLPDLAKRCGRMPLAIRHIMLRRNACNTACWVSQRGDVQPTSYQRQDA